MWHPIRQFSLNEARDFLCKDFLKVLQRTRYLYIETPPPDNIGPGFFEPIILCFCWIDFLGALYCGSGKSRQDGGVGNIQRSLTFLNEVVAKIKPIYATVSTELVKVYRHGTVHAYVPAGSFDLKISDAAAHLSKSASGIVISIEDLIKDLIQSTCGYAVDLSDHDPMPKNGNLAAFNRAREELG